MGLQEEILRSIYALWRLIRLDPDAPQYFNLSTQGFWRSFGVSAILILAIEAMQQGVLRNSPGADELLRPANGILVGSLPHLLLLAIYPVLMIPATRFFGLSGNFITYIIAWNWMTALNFFVAAPIFIPVAVMEIPLESISTLLTILNITLISYATYLAKLALQCKLITAIGFVALDLLLGQLLSMLF
jgi:hypothetical protein